MCALVRPLVAVGLALAVLLGFWFAFAAPYPRAMPARSLHAALPRGAAYRALTSARPVPGTVAPDAAAGPFHWESLGLAHARPRSRPPTPAPGVPPGVPPGRWSAVHDRLQGPALLKWLLVLGLCGALGAGAQWVRPSAFGRPRRWALLAVWGAVAAAGARDVKLWAEGDEEVGGPSGEASADAAGLTRGGVSCAVLCCAWAEVWTTAVRHA